jgi:hypothetical protein
VRPSDENQLGSTRPHLKSARRTASANSNILASLERLANKQHSRTKPRPNPAWLSAGALAVLGLIGTIAWLAHVNATTLRPLPVADARGRPLPDMPAASAARLPAAIIDEPAERAILLARAEIPPLVMLKPAAPPPRPPAPLMVERAAPAPKRTPAKKAAPPKVAAAPKKAPAPPVKTEPEPVDSDVALLSAILSYSSRHAAERTQVDEAVCQAGKKCPAKGPVQP